MPKAKNVKKKATQKADPFKLIPVKTTTNKDVNLLAGGLSKFCFSLQAFLAHDPKSKSKAPLKNLVYSPFCLFSTLAALKLGTTANGKTSKEMDKILHFPSDTSVLRSGFKNIFPSLQSSEFPPEISLRMASRIFVSEGVQLKKEFLDSVENTFGENVTISTLDFGSKDAAAKEINKWASVATGNLVNNVVTKKTLETESSSEKNEKGSPLQILIVSVVYFKGFWHVDFPDFEVERVNPMKGDSVEVPLMHRFFTHQDSFYTASFFAELNATVFSILYKGARLCMIIYLPADPKGLSKMESLLNDSPHPPSRVLKVLYDYRPPKPAIVHMPKFKIECTFDLTEPLKKAGLLKLFTPVPDFSSMTTSKENARVFKVVQKVLFEIDEHGTKTPMVKEHPRSVWNNLGAFIDEISVRNPFYFQIVDTWNDIVLLAGTYLHET